MSSAQVLPSATVCIADLHLDPAQDERIAGFQRWLSGLEAERLLILGDLFDVWVGPAQARLAGARDVLAALAELTARGTAVDVVPGNRDFLLGRRFEAQTGARLHPDGFVAELASGERVLFLHGDELCTLDVGYQRMKRVLRSRPIRALALCLPLACARWAAARLRNASKQAVPRKPPEEKAMQPAACRQFAREHAADTVVCGHAHAFRDESLAEGPRWIVLDAWGGTRAALRASATGDWLPEPAPRRR